MCGPTATMEKISDDEMIDSKLHANVPLNKPESLSDPTVRRRGIWYGTLSLALVVLASSVTMGHYQSQRDSLGCDSLCVGSMTSARSTLTLIGSSVIGRWSDSDSLDKMGGARRLFLLIEVAASALGVVIAASANSIQGLWISMIPGALLQQNFNILKALFGDYHDASASASERAGSVGMLGMAAGLAFMVGPLVGTTIFNTYEQTNAFALICLMVAACVTFILPSPPNSNDAKKADNETGAAKASKTTFFKFFPDLVPAAKTPPAIFLMVARVCMALAFHIFQTLWAVILQKRFHFGPQDYGRYYAFIGLAFALSQGVVAKFLLLHFGKTTAGRCRLLLACSLILGGGRLVVYQTHSLVVVYVFYGAIITALGVVNTVFTADTSLLADKNELGGLFGIFASVESLAGIVGPMLGGALAQLDAERAPIVAVVTLYGIVFGMVYWGYERIVVAGGKNKTKKEV